MTEFEDIIGNLTKLENMQIDLATDEAFFLTMANSARNTAEEAKTLVRCLKGRLSFETILFHTDCLVKSIENYKKTLQLLRRRIANADKMQASKEENANADMPDSQAPCETIDLPG